MKKMCLIAVALIMLSSGFVYADPFGPAEPAAKEGKFTLGVGYFLYQEKLKPADDTFSAAGAVATDFWQKTTVWSNQAYVQASYGLLKNWEVFARLGAADLRAKETFDYVAYADDFRGDYQAFGTLGFKGILFNTKSFSIGPILKASYYSDYKDSATGTIAGTKIDMSYNIKDIWDVNLGLAFQAKINNVVLFAGPFVYWKNAKVDLDITITGTGTFSDSVKYESENNVGGFAGVRIPITKNFMLDVEGQYTNQFSGGAAIVYQF